MKSKTNIKVFKAGEGKKLESDKPSLPMSFSELMDIIESCTTEESKRWNEWLSGHSSGVSHPLYSTHK